MGFIKKVILIMYKIVEHTMKWYYNEHIWYTIMNYGTACHLK